MLASRGMVAPVYHPDKASVKHYNTVSTKDIRLSITLVHRLLKIFSCYINIEDTIGGYRIGIIWPKVITYIANAIHISHLLARTQTYT